ncbi:MAG: ion transporter, partial [Rhodovibrionaceae bacterium]
MAEPRLRTILDTCYNGRTRRAAAFRYALIVFDVSTIVFFIATAPLPSEPWILAVDLVLGCLILADFLARLWIAPSKRRMLLRVYTLADIAVIL